MIQQDEIDQLKEIFFPHLLRAVENLKKENVSLVHYTSAETALKIIHDGKIWMRNANYMADYSEIRTGTQKIKRFFDPEKENKEFWTNLDKIKPGLRQGVLNLYDGWLPELEANTYLLCVSEHTSEENDTGRLSMWRGYGRGSGVALVLNTAPFLAETNVLGAVSYPVIYRNHEQNFQRIVNGINQNISFLATQEINVLTGYLFSMLQSFAFCLKHQGFEEEREWRVVYVPEQAKKIRDQSHLKDIPLPIKSHVETINNIPQVIYKIPLKKIEGLSVEESLNLEIKNLFDRLIIGPCKFPGAVKEAFVKALKEKKVEDAENKVYISNIPLRM